MPNKKRCSAESEMVVRRLSLEIAARAGVDIRTARRAVLLGADALHAAVNRARVVAAARELGVTLPVAA